MSPLSPAPMLKLQGIAVSSGVTIGEALVLDSEGFRIPRRFVARSAVDTELQRLSNAVAESNSIDQSSSRGSSARDAEVIRNKNKIRLKTIHRILKSPCSCSVYNGNMFA